MKENYCHTEHQTKSLVIIVTTEMKTQAINKNNQQTIDATLIMHYDCKKLIFGPSQTHEIGHPNIIIIIVRILNLIIITEIRSIQAR